MAQRGGRPLGTSAIESSDTFTRPSDTTPYALNDRIGPTTSDTATTPLRSLTLASAPGRAFIIKWLGIRANLDTFLCTIRIHFYRVAAPTTAVVGDNTAFTRAYANVNEYLGWWDFPAFVDHGDFVGASSSDIAMQLQPAGDGSSEAASDNVYYALEIVSGTPTPASAQSFTIIARSLDAA